MNSTTSIADVDEHRDDAPACSGKPMPAGSVTVGSGSGRPRASVRRRGLLRRPARRRTGAVVVFVVVVVVVVDLELAARALLVVATALVRIGEHVPRLVERGRVGLRGIGADRGHLGLLVAVRRAMSSTGASSSTPRSS